MMKLSPDQRWALVMLAAAGPRGVPETVLVDVHRFALAELAVLVNDGLATVSQETMQAGGRTVAMTKLRITDAGRQALAGGANGAETTK